MVRSRKKNSTLIAIGVLLAATAVYIGAGKLLSRDAADQYFELESRNFQRIAQSIGTYYNSFMESQKPFLESASRRRLEITADINPGPEAQGGKAPSGAASAAKASVSTAPSGLAGLISNSKLVIDSRSRPETAESIYDISLLADEAHIIDAELFNEKETLYLGVPLLMPGRYFSTRLDRLGEAYDRFSVPIKPARLINGSNIAGILKFDKTTFMGSAVRLAAVFRKFIKADNVRYGQSIGIQLSGRSYKGREIIVSLNEEQATSLLHELAFAVAEDDALLQYTYGNIAELSALLDDAGLFRLYGYLEGKRILDTNGGENSFHEKLNIKKDEEGFRRELQKNAARLTVKDGLVMTLIVDDAGNILDRKTELDLLNTNDNGLSTLVIETGCSNDVFEDPRNRFADIVLTHYGNTASGGNGSSAGSSTADSTTYSTAGDPSGSKVNPGGATNTAGATNTTDVTNPTGTQNPTDVANPTDVTNPTGTQNPTVATNPTGTENPTGTANLTGTANPTDVGKSTELHIRPDFGKSADAGSSGSFTASWRTAIQGGSPSGVDMKLDFSNKTDMLTSEKNRSIDYSVKLTTGSGEGKVSGKWNEVSQEDKQNDARKRAVSLYFNADLPLSGINGFSTILGLTEEDSFGIGPFALPAVNAGNTTDLNTAATKDIERIKSGVLELLGNYQH